jgi:hypothetical protein
MTRLGYILYILFLLGNAFLYNIKVYSQISNFTLDSQRLLNSKIQIGKNNKKFLTAKDQLLKDAEDVLKFNQYYSVTFKIIPPPGGSIHDYYSVSGYRWQDSSKPEGTPYRKIDGKVNPEAKNMNDPAMLKNLSEDVFTLGLAYYFTNEEKFAQKSRSLLSAFFLNKETKMNPNFEFSQMIPGIANSGGATISATALIPVVEGIQFIRKSQSWTPDDQRNMEQWFSKLLSWMLYSQKGKSQSLSKNNIGTYYVLQTSVYALFIGDYDLAKSIIERKAFALIDEQINSEGALPYELRRATPWNYVTYDFTAWDELVEVAKKVNVDLLTYKNKNGASIKDAFDWLIPFATGEKKWNYGNDKVSSGMALSVLNRIKCVDYSNITKNYSTNLNYKVILY